MELHVLSTINDIKNIADTQVHIASLRQKYVEMMVAMKQSISRKKVKVNKTRIERYTYYKTSHDMKLSEYQIKDHIDNDLANDVYVIGITESQIDYYKQSIETLDKVDYKIKYLIEITKFNAGAKF